MRDANDMLREEGEDAVRDWFAKGPTMTFEQPANARKAESKPVSRDFPFDRPKVELLPPIKETSFAAICEALRSHGNGHLAYDEFNNRAVVGGRPLSEDALCRIEEWFSRQGVEVASDKLARAVVRVCRETALHPVRDYLDGRKWDGTPRIGAWLKTYCGAVTTAEDGTDIAAYVNGIGRKFLIGAVARVFEPGCKMDNMLVLEGLQDLGKSTALKILFDPWLSEQLSSMATKEGSQDLQGAWCVELAEMASLPFPGQRCRYPGSAQSLMSRAGEELK